jgi:ABC-type transport system substrate-binding protein
MASVFEDVDDIVPTSDTEVRIQLKRPSPFVLESLESVIQKPGSDGIGTGPFALRGTNELRSFESYYLGRPTIDRITQTGYPSVRTAWAELLRGNLDMLYEVNLDALDSLKESTDVSLFSYLRHYQYMLVFGSHAPNLKTAAIRRELNAAIDREAIVKEGLNGHGIPSTGPLPPSHWALDKAAPKLAFDRKLAESLASRHLRFTCIVPADTVYERIALMVKQQLAAASVDMQVIEATQEQVVKAAENDQFEAILGDVISGPSVFRSYRHWYSKTSFRPKPMYIPLIDAALDRVRHAASDDEYRAGVTAFQQAIVNDPPAIFLAWGERARAVSRRFDVPAPEDSRDVLATLGQWRPKADQRAANSN